MRSFPSPLRPSLSQAVMQVNCQIISPTVYTTLGRFVKFVGIAGLVTGGKTDTLDASLRGSQAPRSRPTGFAMYFIVNILQSRVLRSWQCWPLIDPLDAKPPPAGSVCPRNVTKLALHTNSYSFTSGRKTDADSSTPAGRGFPRPGMGMRCAQC